MQCRRTRQRARSPSARQSYESEPAADGIRRCERMSASQCCWGVLQAYFGRRLLCSIGDERNVVFHLCAGENLNTTLSLCPSCEDCALWSSSALLDLDETYQGYVCLDPLGGKVRTRRSEIGIEYCGVSRLWLRTASAEGQARRHLSYQPTPRWRCHLDARSSWS